MGRHVTESSGLISAEPGKRVHVALPIRVSYWNGEMRTRVEMACTYDIHSRGARIAGLRNVREAGEVITVERGRSKAMFRVSWIGDRDSGLEGQVGIEPITDEKLPWLTELEELNESYCKVPTVWAGKRRSGTASGNRRRAQRFTVNGVADLVKPRGCSSLKGELKEISETGCLLAAPAVISPGSDVRLDLNVANCELTFRAALRHTSLQRGVGIEFRQVRRGDRPLLEWLLRKLEKEQAEDKHWGLQVCRPVDLAQESDSIEYLE